MASQRSSPAIALTIAGFDPSCGAGTTADLKTFAAHGIYGMACITALTVQSTLGVQAVELLPARLIRQTLDCLANDVSIAGVKIGMLGSQEVAGEVCSFLSTQAVPRSRVVLDPVMRSSSGADLIDAEGVAVIRGPLLQLAGWITPNIDELAILDGGGPFAADGDRGQQVVAACHRVKATASRLGNDELNIVATGGHLEKPDDFLLAASGEETWVPGEWVDTRATHGTGCAFSSALLCGLLAGESPEVATRAAKAYVTEALRTAVPIGRGRGPMNHFFPLQAKGK